MNKAIVLHLLLQQIDQYQVEEEKAIIEPESDLQEILFELNNRRPIVLPPLLSDKPDEMIPVLREHFKDNVTLISLILHHHFPQEYLYYRVSKLEEEIFDGLRFFSEIVPAFDLPFTRVGRSGFTRYQRLNRTLLEVANQLWPDLPHSQPLVESFLEGLAVLFLEGSDNRRYWLLMAGPADFQDVDEDESIWSGRKEMQKNDLVFMYRTAPRSAITDLYQVADDWEFDPLGAWDGFWVNLVKVASLPAIPFSEMRTDPLLSEWALVRRQFRGVIAEPVPHSIYNRLLDKIPRLTRDAHGLEPEPLAPMASSGQFTSEADFEERVVIPLLKRWGFRSERQNLCHFRIGSQNHPCRVDFLVKDERGPLTLFEDKFRIRNENQLAPAVEQAKSYALQLGLPSFVVAAPEGFWLYSLERNREELKLEVSGDQLSEQEEELGQMIVRLRQ